jgi:iron-sulfur cluster assembly accessory protein
LTFQSNGWHTITSASQTSNGDDVITITPEAQEKLNKLIASQNAVSGVRVSVVRGPHGCVHGWSLALEDERRSDDVVLTYGELELMVEPDLVDALSDAAIDYREDGTGIGFKIDVPGAIGGGNHGRQGGCGNH